jgi:hypothetical protein
LIALLLIALASGAAAPPHAASRQAIAQIAKQLDEHPLINQRRLCPHPIRVVLADPPLDWSKIKTAKEYVPFMDRDASYAAAVEGEVLAKHHRALLIAGLAHAVKQRPKGDHEDATAAESIERKHPGLLFTIVPAFSAADAESMKMNAPPDFRIVRGSGMEQEDFGKHIWKADSPKAWPPMADVADGVLNIGEQDLLYPSPKIYLEPAYQKELRRRIAIIKEWSGQDFTPALDKLLKEAQ